MIRLELEAAECGVSRKIMDGALTEKGIPFRRDHKISSAEVRVLNQHVAQ